MTDRSVELQPGQRIIVRGPRKGAYTSLPRIDMAAGDTTTITVAGASPLPPPPPPPTDIGPSGIAVPAVKAGWQRVGFSHFDDDIPTGSWTGDKQGALDGRASGLDTTKNGKYTNLGLSQHDSLLDCRMWQDASGQRWMGCPKNKAGSNNNSGVPSLRVTECMRVDAPEAGWKMAHMGAKYGVVQDNEYDFPEFSFKSGVTGKAFLHLHNSRPSFDSGVSPYEWHTYTIEVISGQSVQVEIDGRVIGRATSGVTTDPVHWILQNETAMGTELPARMGEAHVLIDWVTIEVPA